MGIADVQWVETAEQCIKELEVKKWDIVSLDHDLGADDGSGMDVVNYIVREQPFVHLIAIHSWNQPAASLMHEKLWDTHLWEGNLYREVFGETYLTQMQQIIGMFSYREQI